MRFLGRAAHGNDDPAVRFVLSKVFLSEGLKVSAIVRHERALLTGREGQLLLVILLLSPRLLGRQRLKTACAIRSATSTSTSSST